MKTWLAIPALAIACAAIAAAHGARPFEIACAGALGAALAAAVRAFAGASIAATVAGAAAALFGTLALVDTAGAAPGDGVAGIDVSRAALAGACALFAIAELARPLLVAPAAARGLRGVPAGPWPAVGAALAASVLDPSYVALPVIAGARLVVGPWARPRWTIAVPIAGVLAIGLAALAASAHAGALADLWAAWSGVAASFAHGGAGAVSSAHAGAGAVSSAHAGALDVAALAGDALGPLAIVAALAGLAGCVAASRFAAAAVAAIAVGAALASARAGLLAPALPIAAALACGVAVARLAALVRHQTAQTFVGATAAFLLLASSSSLAFWL